MKKAILIVILALSINAFTQNKQYASYLQHQKLNSVVNIQHWIKDTENRIPGLNSKNNPVLILKQPNSLVASLIQLNDSICTWRWDTLSIGWKPIFKTINMEYDANNNLTSEIVQLLNGSTWQNRWKNNYTYDSNNNLVKHLYQSWIVNAWVDGSQNIHTYDENNNQTSHLTQIWNGSEWDNYENSLYTYDSNNNQTSYIFQIWREGAWVNTWLNSDTYDANNNRTIESSHFWNGTYWENSTQAIRTYDVSNNQISFLSQGGNGSDWTNGSLSTFTYDLNNNQTSILIKSWNGSSWDIILKDTLINAYDSNNNLASTMRQTWIDSTWQNSNQDIYTYDSNNNQTSYLTQYWNGTGWLNSRQLTTTYDVNNNPLVQISKEWDQNNETTYNYQNINTYDSNNFIKGYSIKSLDKVGKVVGGDSIYNYFRTVVTGVELENTQEENMTVFPNPSNGKFKILINSNISVLEIYNMLGKRIYADFSFNQQSSNEIDITGQPKGIYIVKINNGTNTYTRRILIQ